MFNTLLIAKIVKNSQKSQNLEKKITQNLEKKYPKNRKILKKVPKNRKILKKIPKKSQNIEKNIQKAQDIEKKNIFGYFNIFVGSSHNVMLLSPACSRFSHT